MSINQITYQEIERLTDIGLTKLVRKLVYLEAIENELTKYDFSKYIPLKITVPDEGCDGEIRWNEGPERTKNFPCRNICLQIKATGMGPEECYKEVLKSGNLKSKIEKFVNENGCYFMICNRSVTNHENNEKRIRDAIKESENENWEKVKISFYDCERIANWVNEYIEAVHYTYELLGIKIDENFITFSEFERININFVKYPYISCKRFDENINSIRSIVSENNGIVRILGLSGLGKTRMVYEALKEKYVQHKFLYFSAKLGKSELHKNVRNIVSYNKSCILVIDECDLEIHKILKKEVNETKVKLITIYNDPTSTDEDQENIELRYVPFIRIEPNNYVEIIEDIIISIFPEFKDKYKNEINRIKEFAMGFPLMAVNIAEDIKKGRQHIGKLSDEILIDKMLGLKKEDKDKRNVLRACSIFEYLGYEGEKEYQVNFIATNGLISNLDYSNDDILKNEFNRICEEFIERGIIDRKGRYIFVKPKPLALRLAAEWWQNFRESEINKFLTDIAKNKLDLPLCNQIAKLDFLPKAKEITKELCGEQGPFGQAEVLNTKQGSRLFRSLVEVNPEETCNTLYRLFAYKDKDYLLTISDGRRNLVWSLEMLCWSNNTFKKAIKVLRDFAVAENEEWANNSTNIFSHLFQIQLPGTEVSLLKRLEILTECISLTKEHQLLSTKALRNALKTHYFTRDVGFEYQGSKQMLIDYKPKGSEIKEYWETCIDYLKDFIIKDIEDISEKASEVLTNSIRGIVSRGGFNIILPIIKEISEKKNYDWPEARNNLKLTLKFERKTLNDEIINQLKELIEKLTPKDFKNKYEMFIKQPYWEEHTDEEGDKKDFVKLNTEKIADECYKEDIWKENINIFYEDFQMNGYHFGFKLGEKFKNNYTDINKFINLTFDALRKIKKDNRNIIVFIGFLEGLNNKELNNDIFKKFLDDEKLNTHSLYLADSVNIDIELFDKLFILVDNGNIKINEFLIFKYTKKFDDAPQSLYSFLEKVSSYGSDGIFVALIISIKFMDKELEWKKISKLVRDLLMEDHLLINIAHLLTNDVYNWEELVSYFLEKNDKEFAIEITNQIIEVLSHKEDYYTLELYLEKVLMVLFSKYFKDIWFFVGDEMLKNSLLYWRLMHLLGSKIEFTESFTKDIQEMMKEKNGILFKGNLEILLEWCKQNSPKGARLVARMLPIYDPHNKEKWHPFTLRFIEEFGKDKKVLTEISAAMGTYSWTGSIVDLLDTEKKLCEQLIDHNIKEVREWANKQVEILKRNIKQESIGDDEMHLNL